MSSKLSGTGVPGQISRVVTRGSLAHPNDVYHDHYSVFGRAVGLRMPLENE